MATNMKRILMPMGMHPAGMALVEARDDVEAVVLNNFTTAQFHEALKDAHGVTLGLTPLGEPELQVASKLMCAARIGVGYDTVDVPALTRRGLPLMIAGVANSVSVAEHAMFLMMAVAKRALDYDKMVRENRWQDRRHDMPVDLWQKTLLIIGFGRIGTRTAKRALGMEMTVLVYDPYVKAETIKAAGCEPVSDLKAGLARADFVTVHCPKNKETIDLIGAGELAAMKKTAYIVNTARGGIINEDALYDALKGGVIKAAGIDVLDKEPPTEIHKLCSLPNIIMAPHMAGVTIESSARMAQATVQNVLDVFDGKPDPNNVVNKEVLKGR
ncbi:MAG: hydroxyacid dehydrogenase [Alphaproteobacteria bacterium]|nr:hydroxyacid dehydrogenase [Alphaproteobacteria bacterium]MCW5742717.1 hydroxyacid dehydrogenase [Alphaproteobacteria bacterium]